MNRLHQKQELEMLIPAFVSIRGALNRVYGKDEQISIVVWGDNPPRPNNHSVLLIITDHANRQYIEIECLPNVEWWTMCAFPHNKTGTHILYQGAEPLTGGKVLALIAGSNIGLRMKEALV